MVGVTSVIGNYNLINGTYACEIEKVLDKALLLETTLALPPIDCVSSESEAETTASSRWAGAPASPSCSPTTSTNSQPTRNTHKKARRSLNTQLYRGESWALAGAASTATEQDVVIVFVNEETDGENDAEFVCEGDDAAAFTEIYKATLGNIEDLHWNEEEQMYCDANINEDEESYYVCNRGYLSLFPFLLALLPSNSPHLKAILDLLHDPNHLLSPYGIRSLSASHLLFGQGKNYWKGPIWVQMNFLALKSLYTKYAAEEGAYQELRKTIYTELRTNIIDNVFKEYKRTGTTTSTMASRSTITSSTLAGESAFTIAVEPMASSMTATMLVHDASTSTNGSLIPISASTSQTKPSGKEVKKDVKKCLPKIIPPPKDESGRNSKGLRKLVLCFEYPLGSSTDDVLEFKPLAGPRAYSTSSATLLSS